MELFKECENANYVGDIYLKDLDREIPLFEIQEPSVEEWNKKSQRANTEAFIREFNRKPRDYAEVLTWVYSLTSDEWRCVPEKHEKTIVSAALWLLNKAIENTVK